MGERDGRRRERRSEKIKKKDKKRAKSKGAGGTRTCSQVHTPVGTATQFPLNMFPVNATISFIFMTE